MAIELQAGAIEIGLQSELAFIQTAFLWLADASVFPPPVEVADIRAKLQLGQPVGYMDTDAFNQYLTRIFGFPLVDASLTVGERTILNNIREYLEPPPTDACCGLGGGVDPSLGNSSIALNFRLGTASYEHELVIKCADLVTCDVASVEVTIAPVAAEPAATVPVVTCNLLGCVSGSTHFSKLWIDFVGNPSGGDYTFSADFKNSIGATIVVLVFPFSFP